MAEKLVNLLLRCGLDEKSYREILPALNDENRINVRIFATIGAFISLIMVFVTMLFPDGFTAIGRSSYLVMFLVLAASEITNEMFSKKYPRVAGAASALSAAVTLAAGVGISLNDPGQRVASYLGIVTVVPAMFTMPPLLYAAMLLVADGILLRLGVFQPGSDVVQDNLINITIFTLVSIIMAMYLMNVKAQRQCTALLNKRLMETDRLTGIYNRGTYEDTLSSLRTVQPDYTVIAFDLNGLKKANDTCGHTAGDEMLCGAAQCIGNVFSAYGKCFRTGGDEFAAILTKHFDREATLKAFDEAVSAWHGERVPNLSVSYGIVTEEESRGMTVDEAVALADKRMYEAKSCYYRTSGIDRRRS